MSCHVENPQYMTAVVVIICFRLAKVSFHKKVVKDHLCAPWLTTTLNSIQEVEDSKTELEIVERISLE